MKVYIVFDDNNYDSIGYDSVWSTEAKAQERLSVLNGRESWGQWSVHEVAVDEVPSP